MIDPLTHAGLLAFETLLLCLVARYAVRTRRSARMARASERAAWQSAARAEAAANLTRGLPAGWREDEGGPRPGPHPR